MSDMQTYVERLWDLGQRHLAAGRYMAARRALETAEAAAWRQGDLRGLARLYLPLLEVRRQMRYLAVEGPILILSPRPTPAERQAVRTLLTQPAGTLLAAGPQAAELAVRVATTARRTGASLECLVLLDRGPARRLASAADATWAGGLDVRGTTDPADMVDPSVSDHPVIPLPPPGLYMPGRTPTGALHALARESLLIAWEELALKWQARHPIVPTPMDELAWLRRTLRIDPACEPVSMRVMTVAEAMSRVM